MRNLLLRWPGMPVLDEYKEASKWVGLALSEGGNKMKMRLWMNRICGNLG